MLWNNNHLDHFFRNDQSFEDNYCDRLTRAPNGDTTVRTRCRILAKRLAILMPSGAHISPGYSYETRPWLIVSCFTGPGGMMDGNWRVGVFFADGHFYLGFHLRKKATRNIAGLRIEVSNRHLLNQYNDWIDLDPIKGTNDNLCIQIDAPLDGDFSGKNKLAYGQPLAEVLQAINTEKLSTIDQNWYTKYLVDRGEPHHGVIVPSVSRLQVQI